MIRRKIQLIAGTTYSVSLPKEWVLKNHLKEKEEVSLFEKNDLTLVISPLNIRMQDISDVSLNVDEYSQNIEQILFAVYYKGTENITLSSKKEITKSAKISIRRALAHMSGAEIIYEDKQTIKIKILLDKSKVDIYQLLYRINLLIESSILNIQEEMSIAEIKINENEIDRLFHLMSKIITISLVDSNILYSSKIEDISLIPSYFLIGKRLENIGDNINALSAYLSNHKKVFNENKREILHFIKSELNKAIAHIIRKPNIAFQKTSDEALIEINEHLAKLKDKAILGYLTTIIRYVIDIDEETTLIAFYKTWPP